MTIIYIIAFLLGLSNFVTLHTLADLIMVDGNGMPSIIENDEVEQDVILMPGMSNMIMSDDLVL